MVALPTIRQMEYLVALDEQGSFSRAATLCNVTQSTLSAGIKELETLLNQSVVDRSRKAVTITPFGQELLDEARLILERAQNIAMRAKKLDSPMAGPMRMGIIPTIAPYALPFLLPGLEGAYPLLELSVHEDLSANLLEKLRFGQLDIAMIAFPYDTQGLRTAPLFREPFYCVGPPYLLGQYKEIHQENLASFNLLLLEEGHCMRDHALAACNFQLVEEKRKFSATSLSTLIHMVQNGHGITLLPEMAIKHGYLPEDLIITPFIQPEPEREVGLVWRNNPGIQDQIRLLTRTFRQIFA